MIVQFTDQVETGPLTPSLIPVWTVLSSAPVPGIAWITALQNGQHMEGSKHTPSADTGWTVAAVDLDAIKTKRNVKLREHLREALPPSFDVILEDVGKENEHIHVEYDPQ
jgi:hypothetical protein